MVRQAETSKLRTLLTIEQVHSCPAVIPAKAGIQLHVRPKDATFFSPSAAHNVLAPDSGLRRNDGKVSLCIDIGATGAGMLT